MRSSDWSSDVCSSDLLHLEPDRRAPAHRSVLPAQAGHGDPARRRYLLPAPAAAGHAVRGARIGAGRVCGGRQPLTGKSAFARKPPRHPPAVGIIALVSIQQLPDTLINQIAAGEVVRSEEHTSELQSLMRISYAVFCLKKKNTNNHEVC